MIRARGIVVLVDAVAEAHQALVAGLHALEEVGDVLDLLDPREHPQRLLVGAAVQRPVQRGDAGGDGRVGVDLGRADGAHGARGGVLFVVGVQDEQHVERALEARIGLVLELGHLVHHPEEVARVLEVVVGVDVRLAHVVAERERRERGHLREQPDDLDRAHALLVDLVGVRVERRQRADGGDEHAHRVGVVAEALHEVLDVLVHERVDRDLVDPAAQLGLVGQPAVDQQVGDLEVAWSARTAARSGSRGAAGCRRRRRCR